ncbi:MAG: TRL-like family protein [Methylohalobius sp. ZOD2]|nr:TRL-like family protein [Methylothermaceae bacterium]
MFGKIIGIATIAGLGLLGGCATPYPTGVAFTDTKLPIHATSLGDRPHKTGVAECTSILSLIATGDCSIEAAKLNGDITKVHHVDWDAHNILGIYGKYKVMVYGE